MGDKGDKSAARPPEGCPAEAGGLFGPESALGFEHPSGTNARRPSQKAGGVPPYYQNIAKLLTHLSKIYKQNRKDFSIFLSVYWLIFYKVWILLTIDWNANDLVATSGRFDQFLRTLKIWVLHFRRRFFFWTKLLTGKVAIRLTSTFLFTFNF